MRTEICTEQSRAFEQSVCEEAPRLLRLAFLLTGDRDMGELALLRSVESMELTRDSDQQSRWTTAIIAESFNLVTSQLSASIKRAEVSLLRWPNKLLDLPSPEWSMAHEIEDDDVDRCLLMLPIFPRWLLVLRTLCKFSPSHIALFLQVDPELVDVNHQGALFELTRSLAIIRGWIPVGVQNTPSNENPIWMAL